MTTYETITSPKPLWLSVSETSATSAFTDVTDLSQTLFSSHHKSATSALHRHETENPQSESGTNIVERPPILVESRSAAVPTSCRIRIILVLTDFGSLYATYMDGILRKQRPILSIYGKLFDEHCPHSDSVLLSFDTGCANAWFPSGLYGEIHSGKTV